MEALQSLMTEYDQVAQGKPAGGNVKKSATTTRQTTTATGRASSLTRAAQSKNSTRPARPNSSSTIQRVGSRNASLALASAGRLAASSSRSTTPESLSETGASPKKEGTTEPVARAVLAEPRESRQEACARLAGTPFLAHGHRLFMHGRGYVGPEKQAKATWKSDKPPRKDHYAPDWLTATEFQDEADIVDEKCRQLAELLRISKKTVLYTGAGISASVIGQAALSGQNKVGWKPDKMGAKPTFTHHALGFLGRQGIIHSWVQQNHDGLPQKAGFPQECINEIHGSWYDPCNPVVKYSGSLHGRSFPWMENDAETADLVLVLGTSLGGLNADQVAINAAERSCSGQSLGTVCINLQQTAEDGKMTLRFFGRSDDILARLLTHLGFPALRPGATVWPKESRVLVPYDAEGKKVPEGGRRMWLDLSNNQKVRITDGHNIQGAKQPQFMHIGGKKGKPGHGSVSHRDEHTCSFQLVIEGAAMRLGLWWLDAAARGAVDVLPIVNLSPSFENDGSRTRRA